tara:strand:+ start:801 stop:926 length:126 start_codon:yes stop_codon:yes gene_type:complete
MLTWRCTAKGCTKKVRLHPGVLEATHQHKPTERVYKMSKAE